MPLLPSSAEKLVVLSQVQSENIYLYQFIEIPIYLWLYSPFVGPWPLFSFLIVYTAGRTPRTGDQPAARPLPAHRTAQTQNKLT
jgi:hypothetical protein